LKRIFLLLFLSQILACTSPDSRVTITGEFPAENAEVWLTVEQDDETSRYTTYIKDGKFQIKIDSVEKGVYNIIIGWARPFDKRYFTYRDKKGAVTRVYKPQVLKYHSINKKLYINPAQSLTYHISTEKDINKEFIDNLDSVSYMKTNLLRLRTASDAEDTQLFERLDSAKEYFTGYTRYLIFDSLYNSSKRKDKIDDDFIGQAIKLNIRENYPTLLKTRREIIKNHLDNPIAAWDILDIGNDQLLAEIDEYEKLLEQMKDRAKESPYYKQAILKLSALKRPLVSGETLAFPTGYAPDGGEVNFTPAFHRYTLVEFWASWCAPCRVQNPDWNELLYHYKDKGFQILGVSLDVSEANWRKAIESDHLDDWIHISDLGDGFRGSNALRYGIQAIPFNILIDQQGRIVTQNIRPAELGKFLEKN